jgi:predicted AlkP superfamily pyrophosphatase or phosphodiesterase
MYTERQNIPPSEKLKQVCDWLDMPIHSRPQLITTYIPNVDQMGHKGGPDSKQVEDALQLVDGFIGGVVESLAQRNLSDIVNVIVVSDHGGLGADPRRPEAHGRNDQYCKREADFSRRDPWGARV